MLLTAVLLASASLPGCGSSSTDPSSGSGEEGSGARPNIVLVLADDMGYSDIGSYGAPVIETSTLDRLSENGLRFTQFYNTARCVPTRASLLTGLYPHQAGLGHMTFDQDLPGYRGDLNEHNVTIAKMLGEAGYSTYMSGKWHVTPFRTEDPTKHNWPLQRGFDRFFGTIIGAGSYYDPAGLVRGNQYISPGETGDGYTDDDFYYTDAISDYAARQVRTHAQKRAETPFFLYVSYTAPHWPLHAPEEAIETYEGRFDIGWDRLRQRRYDRAVELGLIDEQWPLTERDPKVPAWDEAKNKDWQARRMAVYAAQIDRMDQGIGRIVGALEQTGQLENTLILFLSDNGGAQERFGWVDWRDYPESEGATPPDSGEVQTSLYPKVTRTGEPIQLGNMPEYMPGPEDTYQSYGRPWANVSNTPFREYKHLVHEGGIATPLIAHWPAGIEREGKLVRQPGHVVDLMATAVDLGAASYPDTVAGRAIRSMQGLSLVPAFRGQELRREDPLFFEHQGNRAIRDGKWKAVAKGPPGPEEPSWEPSWEPGSWELYDMEADRTETDDLAETRPERLKKMVREWESMARRVDAVPWPYGGTYGTEAPK
jgi:arylsulfatase